MNENNIFVLGKCIEPIEAVVLHLDKLEPMKIHSFLKNEVNDWEVNNYPKKLVFLADEHLDAKKSQLKVLKKAVGLAGFEIVGVMGDNVNHWKDVLQVAALDPILKLISNSLKKRQAFLKEHGKMLDDNFSKEKEEIENSDAGGDDGEEVKHLSILVDHCLERIEIAQKEMIEKNKLTNITYQNKQFTPLDINWDGSDNKNVKVSNISTKTPLGNNFKTLDLEYKDKTDESLNIHVDGGGKTKDIPTPTKTSKENIDKTDGNENHRIALMRKIDELNKKLGVMKNKDENKEAEPLNDGTIEDEKTEQVKKDIDEKEKDVKYIPYSLIDNKSQIEKRKITGRVRSGQVIEHVGDIIVEGSVHAGAEIRSGGDVHIYGVCGGRVYSSDENGSIYIDVFDAELISIGGKTLTYDDLGDEIMGKNVKITLENGKLKFKKIGENKSHLKIP